MKQELIEIICKTSFQYSKTPKFKLVSGKMSNFYINCKPTTLNARGMFLIGHLFFSEIYDLKPDAIGGLTFGADPIAVSASLISEIKKSPFDAFSIRKNKKDHGIVKWIEGDLKKDSNIVIIEDVVTTGGSTIKAIKRAKEEGLNILRVVTLIDRQEGGIENIKKYISDVRSIITKNDLMKHINQ